MSLKKHVITKNIELVSVEKCEKKQETLDIALFDCGLTKGKILYSFVLVFHYKIFETEAS
jgi:hypothetical protein